MEAELRAKVDLWMSQDPNPETRAEIQALVDKEEFAELDSRLNNRMVFGTAGLRGPIRAGFNSMNELTIIQAAQGLADYVNKMVPNAKDIGVVVGHDARYKSRIFSEITAVAFAHFGIPTRLFSEIVPTPFVPYLVRRDGCACGVMVTASHNPAADNGYKCYGGVGWGDGVQINPPHDTNIENSIVTNAEPWAEMRDFKTAFAAAEAKGLITDPLDDVRSTYYKTVSEGVQFRSAQENATAHEHVKVAYSAMHGVGYRYFNEIIAHFGFDLAKFVAPVECQVHPDPAFPTSAKPNPERPENLRFSKEVAEEHGCRVVIANDPDADRVALAEHMPNGEWHTFHGNEIGALLADWLFQNERQRQGSDFDPSKIGMINSTVSSKFIQRYAEVEGAVYEEVLTGFRWIGSAADRMMQNGIKPLFGFEEAIGFMCGPTVLDKDGISAAAVVAEMITTTYAAGSTLSERYQKLMDKYGNYVWNNSFIELSDLSLVDRVFHHLHTAGGDASTLAPGYLDHLGEFKIASVRDQQTPGLDTAEADRQTKLPTTGAPMLTYRFENGVILTLRPSGTEPLLKYYCAANGKTAAEAQALVDAVVEELTKLLRSIE